MADSERLALIHAEIDGDLDGRQSAELARCLLADPEVRVLREDLRRLCSALAALELCRPHCRRARCGDICLRDPRWAAACHERCGGHDGGGGCADDPRYG